MIGLQTILDEVAAKHGLSAKQLVERNRTRPIAIARHEAIGRMRKETDASLTQIGIFMGRRDHSAIYNSEKRYEAMQNGQ